MNSWGQCCHFWVWGTQALVSHCNTAKEPLGLTWWKQWCSTTESPLLQELAFTQLLQGAPVTFFEIISALGERSGNCHTAILCTLQSPLMRGLSPLVLLFGHYGRCLGGDVMREKTRSLITNLLPLMSLSVPGWLEMLPQLSIWLWGCFSATMSCL